MTKVAFNGLESTFSEDLLLYIAGGRKTDIILTNGNAHEFGFHQTI